MSQSTPENVRPPQASQAQLLELHTTIADATDSRGPFPIIDPDLIVQVGGWIAGPEGRHPGTRALDISRFTRDPDTDVVKEEFTSLHRYPDNLVVVNHIPPIPRLINWDELHLATHIGEAPESETKNTAEPLPDEFSDEHLKAALEARGEASDLQTSLYGGTMESITVEQYEDLKRIFTQT